ncbi:hypothetical protein CCACVL1_19265 [Corchorus capsularis]|uniref:non-specific serine/threonine protein kinase n=1 Tax=Corchorus capsularis TaxID=210143 RepID=A0A1R3HHL3_COCAP|nr:hypothetical protein CCACVL1_19265 [Corchorus capsularis]
MWRFKPFMQKEPAGLEGRSLDVANLKLHVRNAIAEGGFSCVYLAKDALHASKQYALKHIICNDQESLDLVLKEISVMKSLQGHPNIVTLYAHTILDLGRTKEALLVMEFCDKSLVNVLETRGAAAYFEEKQVLTIFRDVCNAVFAMHCQLPPIAHRDLKVENLLLGSDGLWKLCDFGSTSTNHKRFEKPEEMGIEEDNIRKHTTPAYRAPEMWDLFRRELINEKVDIWALGCLLFRICYFKNAFDGESKLQILNGNYRIPDLPKYSSSVIDLIKDMLQSSPDDRPDITQVWFRVNEQLPVGLQKSLPDRPPEMPSIEAGVPRCANRSTQMPRRSPPPTPSGEPARSASQPGSRGVSGQLGAFWSTQHAKDSLVAEDKFLPKFDEDATRYISAKHDRSHPENHPLPKNTSPVTGEKNVQSNSIHRSVPDILHKSDDGPSKDFEINFFEGKDRPTTFQDEAFNSFVAEFDTNKICSGNINKTTAKEEELEAEIERLKEQLKQVNSEKVEMTSKFEKLSAICRSQRQEIQELKQALAGRVPSPSKSTSRNQNLPGSPHDGILVQREKIEGTLPEFPQEKYANWTNSSPEAKPWQAFSDDGKSQQQQPLSKDPVQSVRTRNSHSNKHSGQATSGMDTWGFGTDSFTAAPAASSQRLKPISEGSSSQRFGTDDDLPPSHQNRIPRTARIAGNGRATISSVPYSRNHGETDMESQIHQLEQEAYSSVLRAFKAQADAITWEKESLITELRKELRLSNEEHRELLSRVNADDVIRRIREWRQAGMPHSSMHNTGQAVHDPMPSPTASASRKKQKTAQSVPSQSINGPSLPLHPQTVVPSNQPSSSAARRGSISGSKKHKPGLPCVPSVKSMQYPSTSPVGRSQAVNRVSSGSAFVSEPAEGATFDPLIGKKVRTRWPDDNNFYEAVITDYNLVEGRHALVYDTGTANETWEWVNLSEISPEDIQWESEDPGIPHRGVCGGSGHGMSRSVGRDGMPRAGRGRGLPKGPSRKDFVPVQNGSGKKAVDDIQILHTDTLIKEVERVFGANLPDALEIEKAKRVLKEHEQALLDAIAKLADIFDGESGKFFFYFNSLSFIARLQS